WAALIIFIGFVLTFLPQFVVGHLGMLRRISEYSPEYQVHNVLSMAGASILGVGYALPLFYLIWSLGYGKKAGPNPWQATGLEWQTPSPPPPDNFAVTPVVTQRPYNYEERSEEHTSELQSRGHLVCRLLLEKKKKYKENINVYDHP